MFLEWWILLVGVLMLVAFSIIYLLEWKHPRLKLPHVDHSLKLYFKGCGYVLVNLFTAWLMASYLFFVSKYVTGVFSLITDNFWLQFLMSFLFMDLIMYWWHRINHIVYPLWKFHELHHEEKELNIYSTFHFHHKEIFISTGWKTILFPLIGIRPESLIIYEAVFFSVILFHHSNFKLGFIWDKIVGSIIVTPGLHHIHHSVNITESNSNYGSVFSFWDRLFGSITLYRKQQITYGVDPAYEVPENHGKLGTEEE